MRVNDGIYVTPDVGKERHILAVDNVDFLKDTPDVIAQPWKFTKDATLKMRHLG